MRNPLKRPNKSGKGYFCTTGSFKCTMVFKMKICNLQMFSRPSDVKSSFVCSNFVLLRIIRMTELYSEPSRTCAKELFAQLLTIFMKSSILDIQLGFEYASA